MRIQLSWASTLVSDLKLGTVVWKMDEGIVLFKELVVMWSIGRNANELLYFVLSDTAKEQYMRGNEYLYLWGVL